MNDARPNISSTPILRATLVWGGITMIVLAAIYGGIGMAMYGTAGLWSGVSGILLAGLFLSFTAISILIANRWFGDDLYVPIFFGIVLGGWLLKLVLFVVVLFIIKGEDWVQPQIFFLSVVTAVVVSLVIDAVTMLRMRQPYASDVVLPQTDPMEQDSSTP